MQPERFGRYDVIGVLGDGAMGRVYLARDPVVGREVAIKTVKPEYLRHDSAREFVERFRREAQAAGALNHPSIVAVFDVGDDYIVMERLVGRTLQEVIAEDGHLPAETAFAVLAPIADALDHAHAAGIVHRDIKPGNIMVQTDGAPKLMDFGVAHVEDSVLTVTGQILGSPSYMSPEQVAGLEVTARSDVYSLAVVAYEMLTGQSPFPGPTITAVIYKVLHDPAPPPRKWNADLPARFDGVFARALAKDPAVRFGSARELASALEVREIGQSLDEVLPDGAAADARADGQGAEGPPAPAAGDAATLILPPPVVRRSRRGGLVVGLVAGAALVLLVVLVLAWRLLPGAPSPSPLETGVGADLTEAPAARMPAAQPPGDAATEPAATPRDAGRSAAPARAGSASTPRTQDAGEADAARDEFLVEMGPGVTPPRRIEGTPAPYPEVARERHIAGSVTVSLIVTETGEVVDPTVTESGGDLLDEAVLEAVRGWRFEPARKDGRAVRVRYAFRQTYRLDR
jgi:eukaryotic-like serine/threonine-protein kinase